MQLWSSVKCTGSDLGIKSCIIILIKKKTQVVAYQRLKTVEKFNHHCWKWLQSPRRGGRLQEFLTIWLEDIWYLGNMVAWLLKRCGRLQEVVALHMKVWLYFKPFFISFSPLQGNCNVKFRRPGMTKLFSKKRLIKWKALCKQVHFTKLIFIVYFMAVNLLLSSII